MISSKRKRDNSDPSGKRDTQKHGDHRRKKHPQQRHQSQHGDPHHRFGRVMSQPPKLKLKQKSSSYPTVSIAIPGSFISNAQTRELQTQLAGQIARAAAVFRVDEIVVYDDGLGSTLKIFSNFQRGRRGPRDDRQKKEGGGDGEEENDRKKHDDHEDDEGKHKSPRESPSTDPHAFLARILQYCECPQYLRRKFFPMHPDLQFAGLLPPLDAPHHLRRGDVASFREGVVVDEKVNESEGGGSLVDCGVPNRLIQIDRVIAPGIRCTVRIDLESYGLPSSSKKNRQPQSSASPIKKGALKGTVVSPTTPRDEDGIYWGYTTRMASSISAIFDECPYEGGYDLKVGTSERGDISVDDPNFCLKRKRIDKSGVNRHDADDELFNHLLIVFGGVAGIEESVDADESMKISGEDSKKMFDVWVNICPYQGSRTIRTEEAVFIAMARFSPFISKNINMAEISDKSTTKKGKQREKAVYTEDVEFSDEAVSDESSEEE